MHTIDELQEKQALPLDLKIRLTRDRVRAWIHEYGENGVYISFSGGKDSTVLLDLVRNEYGYKDVKAMFVDVPTQYPELRQFIKTFDNVDIVQPKINFFQVCEKYGFPLISKEVSQTVWSARNSLKKGEQPKEYRYQKLMGIAKDKDGNPSIFNMPQWRFLLDAPFDVSEKCCTVMKKAPAHKYHRDTGRVPITAQMASESRLRTQKWIQNGCNGFHLKIPTSNPMSFWTEQDVLRYIKDRNLKICSVYGEVVSDDEEMGQMQLSDYEGYEMYDRGEQPLHCTGCDRTGCVLCGFGAHLDPERFPRLRKTHPKMYALLDVCQNNGYTMRQAIDWISQHSDKVIKY